MKHQLVHLPIVGFYARQVGCVAVNRDKKGGTVKKMIRELRKDINRQTIVYPQGTRVIPGARLPYKQGAGIIYTSLEKKCYLVATNTGIFWARRSYFRYPGTAVIDFFECIDDEEAAKMLFDTAKNWLEKNGYNSMDGPINFGERDKWWGCLVEGFDIDPNYLQNYGKAYYQKLFENYGFQLLFRQLTFLKKVRTPLSEKLSLKAERALRDPNYNFKTLEKRNIQKYIRDFTKIYNDAWSKYPGVSKLELSQAKLLFAQLKPILDEKILWFAYHNNDPVGFFISIPEMNQIFKHVNGKLDLFGKLKTFYHLKIKKSCKKMVGLVFGIVPKHQGKGVDGALIMASRETIQEKLAYEDLELNWIPDFNKSMIRVAEQVQVKLGKIHHTYRYNFDRSIPVERITKK